MVPILVGVVACARPVPPPRVPGPPLEQARLEAVFDPQAQVERRPSEHDDSPLRVLDMQPVDRSHGEPIQLRFDRPVAGKDALPEASLVVERQRRDDGWSTVPGQTAWTRTDRLRFAPSVALPGAHRIRVRLEGDVDGIEDVAWTFETPRPSLDVLDRWQTLRDVEPLRIWCDETVSADVLAKHLTVATKGKTLSVRVKEVADDGLRGGTVLEVRPIARWPRGTAVEVEVDAAFRTDEGVLPLGEAIAWPLETLSPFRIRGIRCEDERAGTCPLGPVSLVLGHTPEAYDGITMRPEPEDFDVSWSEDGVVLDGRFEAGQRYTVRLPRGLRDDEGQRFEGPRTATVLFRDDLAPGEASLRLSSAGGVFARLEDAKVGVLGRRVRNARVKVAVLDAQAAAPYLRVSDADDAPAWPEDATKATIELGLARAREEGPTSHSLDLSRWAGIGDTVLVEVESVDLVENTREAPAPRRGVFRMSGLGVWSHIGPARGLVRVTDVASGKARVGARVDAVVDGTRRRLGETDAHGLLALPGAVDLDAPSILIVEAGTDRLPMPLGSYDWDADYSRSCRPDAHGHCHYDRRWSRAHRWPRTDEATEPPPKPLRRGERALIEFGTGRGLFMPGDTVNIAGWVGISTPHGDHNTRRMPEGTTIALTLSEGRREVATGEATVNAHGRFFESIHIPEGARLGVYHVEATALGGADRVRFEVSEPRLPTFEVAAAPVEPEITRGETLRVNATAQYLSGEPAPIERLDWVVECWDTTPNLPDLDDDFSPSTSARIPSWTKRGRLEGTETSTLQVRLATDALDHRAARRCSVSVAGQDPSAQPIGADTAVLVHPGPGYVVAALSSSAFVGDRPLVRARVVDHDGRPIAADSVSIDVRRVQRSSSPRVALCEASKLDVGTTARCRLPSLKAGKHRVRVAASIDGAPLELTREIWVRPRPKPAVAKAPVRPARVPSSRLTVDAPDEAHGGQPFDVKIAAPWPSGEGVLLLDQTGLRRSIPFLVREGKATVSVTPLHGAGEVLELTARMSRPDRRPKRASVVTARASVFVFDRKHLDVVVKAPDRVEPGTKTNFSVTVRDGEGEPVDARLAIWVVDDALHELRRPPYIDLRRGLNPHRPLENVFTDMHHELLDPFNPFKVAGRGRRAPRVRQARAMVKGALTVDARDRFDPAPLFIGDMGTGDDGVVRVPLQLGDDLTRFRIHVVASAELAEGTGPALFGQAGALIEASTPMPMRAALPRVLRPGDRAEMAAIVSAPSNGTVVVQAKTREARVRVVGPSTRTRRVEAGQVVRVPFSTEARRAGEDAITFVATFTPTDGEVVRGGVRRGIDVEPERTAVERAAVHGSVASDQPLAIPIALPDAKRGSVDVQVTSTVLGDLTDAADYLVDYPYGCVEQTSSRLIPLVAIAGLKGRVPSADGEIDKALAHLLSMQRPDGRFSYWPGGAEASSFGTAYATWVLVMAREAGVAVPEEELEKALEVLKTDVQAPLPASTWARTKAVADRVQALRALSEAGPVSSEAVDLVWTHRERLPVFSRLLMLQVMHRNDPDDARVETLLASLSSSIETRSGVAHVVDPTERQWWWMFSSTARTQAIALMTLQEVSPDDPRIELLAKGLRAQRRGGRWRNTQENAFALLGLSKYAAVAEAEVSDQRVQAWVGTKRVVDASVEAFDPTGVGGAVSLQQALVDRTIDHTHVVLHRKGKGRAYYRVGVEWTPETAPARAQGVSISRWMPAQIRIGDQGTVQVFLETDAPLHHLAVEVPLPPGIEAVDTRLGAGARARVLDGQPHAAELSHYELRPDRVLLFFDTLSPGTTRHSIPIAATTVGTYTVPAAVAEAMYEPETRGRTERGTLKVLPRR